MNWGCVQWDTLNTFFGEVALDETVFGSIRFNRFNQNIGKAASLFQLQSNVYQVIIPRLALVAL